MANKFFSQERIIDALNGLQRIDSRYIAIPLVLAASGIDQSAPKKLEMGTDRLLQRFFSLDRVNLPEQWNKNNFVRPRFKELTPAHPTDHGKYGAGKLWANTYSQSGYVSWVDQGWISRSGTNKELWKLEPQFEMELLDRIPPDFRFEDFLVWTYAVSGFPETINSWDELFVHFVTEHSATGAFPPDYAPVFKTTAGLPWPTDLQNIGLSGEEFRRLLFPASNSDSVEPEHFAELASDLDARLKDRLRGFTPDELSDIARQVVSCLSSGKTVFLLGEPGTGKTEIAKLVAESFSAVFSTRVFVAMQPVLQSSTSAKLFGFSSLDGEWLDGALASPDESTGRRLFYKRLGKPPQLPDLARSQVNLLVLDEANRQDLEGIIGRIQIALDSRSTKHLDPDYKIVLDNSGEHFISPFTFVVYTGNSPKSDVGRKPQSRPQRRRQSIVIIRNVFSDVLRERTPTEFAAELAEIWLSCFEEVGLGHEVANKFAEELRSADTMASALQKVLMILEENSVGITYGVVKKFIRAAAANYSLSSAFPKSFDEALTNSLLAMLSVEGNSGAQDIKTALLNEAAIWSPALPLFRACIQSALSDVDSLNRIKPFF
jgi:MoxR-like ATPase